MLYLYRSNYEQEVNEIKIQLHFHWTYHFVKGALNSIDEPLYPLELLIDRRKTLQDLFISISEVSPKGPSPGLSALFPVSLSKHDKP